ncbi:hypothetical protein WJ0W_002199 [Paenibacillus melissococcoides]|uniref:Uncharacterized protein n=1 Tax=Paenibacillus melissococcoides TaxID=2912268 RepID=A0ABM9G184_9BACL|nr:MULTISPECIES: hypothetical protein [Paenibacillus]MEB9895317.1 hypothetical protein [Bacillus cereus]CAH8244969.1 hypothetical protein WJ0W_002199 [Paenibacillus melissococcoides]CAH8709516.1 hypothetical protein WDD9_002281 [Paenibacillus melissococcoides]CAH8710243.1 hypothetical protein HTL2_002568 [Paenibacillus melissococcoides]
MYESHEQLAADFAKQARQDRERVHDAKKTRIAELWETDRQHLLSLPDKGFEHP